MTGPNGAGKTNLLEAVHLATQGLSFRTRHDAQIVRNGAAIFPHGDDVLQAGDRVIIFTEATNAPWVVEAL